MTLALSEMSVNKDVMQDAVSNPELYATDVLEYLVNKGMAFRAAHETVAEVVAHAREKNVSLTELPISDYKSYSGLFAEDVFDLFNPKLSVSNKTSPGGAGQMMNARP